MTEARIPGTLPGWLQKAIIVGALLLALLLLGKTLRVPYRSNVQSAYTSHVEQIQGSVEVGQTFESLRPFLSGVAFQVATYSDRKATGEAIFELRRSPDDTTVLRTVRVPTNQFRDHAWHTFAFAPLPDSSGQTYYASLRSPSSRPGDAVTLDFSTENPYVKGGSSGLFVFRDDNRTPKAVQSAEKPGADLVFAALHRISIWERARLAAFDAADVFRRQTRRVVVLGLTGTAAIALAATVLGTPAFGPLTRRPLGFSIFLAGLFALGVLFRLQYADRLPVTNDEGSMLYDAWVFSEGRLPGGDGVLKTPTVVQALAAVLRFIPEPTLLIGRLVSILAGALTLVPLLVLGRAGSGKRAQALRISGLWLLAAAPAIFSVYLHAQPFQLLLLTSGLVLFSWSFQRAEQREESKASWRWIAAFLGGVLLALAFGARKTSLAAGLPALGILLLSTLPWRVRLRTLALVGVGFLLAIGGLAAELGNWYGAPGVRYFLGLDVAAIDPNTTASPEERRDALIHGVLPIFREGLPVIFLALVGLGASMERLLAFRRGTWWSRFGWLPSLAALWFGGRFLEQYERPEYFAFALWPLWLVMGAAVAILAISARESLPTATDEFPQSRRMILRASGIPLLWLVGTTVLYASWIKFTANYLAEFLPPLILLAALGGAWLVREYRRRLPVLLLLGALVAWGAYASARSGYVFEHTGTFDRSSLEEAAAVLRRQVPAGEPILTAAVAIPVLSGHRVLLDVAHPTHYAYGYIEPHVRNIYMASSEAMVAAVQATVRWIVLERLTAFSYFREYPEIEQLVKDAFEPIAEIENLSNPITILRRREQIQ